MFNINKINQYQELLSEIGNFNTRETKTKQKTHRMSPKLTRKIITKKFRNFYKNVKTFSKLYIQNETPAHKLKINFSKNFRKCNWYTKLQTYTKIEIPEIKEAIFNMENGKSPGIDGLPIEFYKEFYEQLKYDLQDL